MSVTAGNCEFSLVGTAFLWALFSVCHVHEAAGQAPVTTGTCPQGAMQ